MNKFYVLYNTIYYDALSQSYNNILTLDNIPSGILNSLVKFIKISQISRNKIVNNNICAYAIINDKDSGYYTYNQLPQFITYLLNNNYKIYTDLDINIYNFCPCNRKAVLYFYI